MQRGKIMTEDSSIELVALGRSGLTVPRLCFGSSALGDMPNTYGYSVDEERARQTVRAIFDGPAKFIDVSRNYGAGRSEARIGDVIRERGGLPEGVVLSTKLDRDMETGRFDADRARRSLEESLKALNLDRIPLLHLHDPEYAAVLDEVTRADGAVDELFKIKEEGLASAVGLAAGRVDVMLPILQTWDFDALITHNRYTLLNRHANSMIDLAQNKGMAVLNAAPYCGGVFAKGTAAHPRYVYQDADDRMLAPVREVEALCARHEVPPGALALQFSMRDRRITSTICGVSKPERVQQTVDWAAWPISDVVWQEIAGIPFSTDDPEATRVYKPD
ncbi:MAG: aldo/keto reductase [Geminicoccaceae bacterium]